MARLPLATIADLEALLGRAVDDTSQGYALLGRASAIVRAYAGRTWLNDDESALVDVPPDVPGVVVAMVERATRNPDGLVGEQAGEYGRQFGAQASERVYMTRDEKMVVNAAVGRRFGLGTISLTRGEMETPSAALPAGFDEW